MLTGFFAFDCTNIIKIYGKEFTVKRLIDAMGWKNMAVFSSMIIVPIGNGISGFITDVTKALFKGLF